MDVKAYRDQYEQDLTDSGAAGTRNPGDATLAAPGAGPAQGKDLGDDIPALLRTLDDGKQPTPVRVAALLALCAARFLGARFAAHRAAFLDILRKLATPTTAPELREPAVAALSQANDATIQQMLKDGLRDPAQALVGPIKALQLLSEDDHSGVSQIAFDLFHTTGDLSLKEAALRAMSSSVASQDLFANLVKDKSQPQSLRTLSATGLNVLDPDRFAQIARDLVHDDGDFPEIRATVLGALANSPLHQRLKADGDFLGQVLKLGAEHVDTLRASALRFLGRT